MTDTAVILPTYNEVETAPVLVSELLEYSLVKEIIVVDDDSSDGTVSELRGRFGGGGREHHGVTIIERTDESGLSSAVIRGFDAADSRILACMDADGQHPVGAAVTGARLVAETDADMALGTRRGESGNVAGDWPLWRQCVSAGATALAKTAVPQTRGLSDPMTGLFAIESAMFETARDSLRPTGYKIGLELLARCPVASVEEFGYSFREREHGSSNLGPAEYLRYVRHLGRLTVPSRVSSNPEVTPDVAD
jgi:dolichol-phosphate mannosyltransferase